VCYQTENHSSRADIFEIARDAGRSKMPVLQLIKYMSTENLDQLIEAERE
jgi:hypothetical protein